MSYCWLNASPSLGVTSGGVNQRKGITFTNTDKINVCFALALTCFLQSKEVLSESKEARGESEEVLDYSAEGPDKVQRVLLENFYALAKV